MCLIENNFKKLIILENYFSSHIYEFFKNYSLEIEKNYDHLKNCN